MIESSIERPLIVVDLKKHRIRIHKSTLSSIGSPNYILLLVNPGGFSLAILRSDRFNPRAHHIPSKVLESGKPIELYSRSLIKTLHDLCRDWQEHKSYRLYGDTIPNEGIVLFYMSDALSVKGDEI